MSQIEVCLWGVLKSLAAVEAESRSDPLFLFLHRRTNGVQDQIYSLPPPGLAGCNAVIAEVPNHGTIQHPLFGVDIRDVRYPSAVGTVRMNISAEQILIFVKPLSHLRPFPAAADLRQQIILLHDPQYSFGIAENVLTFQPQPHLPIAVSLEAAFLLLCNAFCKSSLLLRPARAMDKGVAAASGYCKKRPHDGHRIHAAVTII